DSLSSSQALSLELGSLGKLDPPGVGGCKTLPSVHFLTSECPSAYEMPPPPPCRVDATLIHQLGLDGVPAKNASSMDISFSSINTKILSGCMISVSLIKMAGDGE